MRIPNTNARLANEILAEMDKLIEPEERLVHERLERELEVIEELVRIKNIHQPEDNWENGYKKAIEEVLDIIQARIIPRKYVRHNPEKK